MKKGIVAAAMAIFVTLFAVSPAFAGTMNSNERSLYNDFCANIDSKVPTLMSSSKASKFKANAESALTNDAIDLDAAACNELRGVMNDVMAYLDANVSTREEARAAYATIAGMINKVSTKYGITVIVNSTTKNGEFQINGKTVATSGGSLVKQTGFGLAQTAAVAAVAALTLCGAFAVARKNQLFA